MSRRAHNVGQSTQVTAHSLAILGEHTHTLDSVPLDLSRSFADLRELDAVLSSSMTLLAAKITELTVMLENKTESKEKCLWLLAQIAEEATRLKVGGDDKIRVACHAADTLRAHNSHMKELMNAIPDRDFDNIEPLGRRTIFPHVATRSYMPLGGSGEGGRRQRRAAHSSLLTSSAVDASPNKRKRVTGRDDEAEVVAKTPRKDRQGEPSRQRVTARNRRPERATSPAESLVSVASHMPPAPQATGNPPNSRASIKRSRAAHNANTPGHNTMDPSPHIFDVHPPSSATHPSLPAPFVNGAHIMDSGGEWAAGLLPGPGIPPVRDFAHAPAENGEEGAGNPPIEGDAENDDGRTYCFCNRQSFGDMIACDDSHCEREWFHLPCIGLTVPPAGLWFCSVCEAKRARKSGRGGKKRPGGGRAAPRNTSA